MAADAAAGRAAGEIQAGIRSLAASGPLWQLKAGCLHYCRLGYSLNRSCPAQRVALGGSDLAELSQRPGPMTFSYRSCSTYVNSPDCRFVHSHHHAESVLLFPALRRANPALNPV